MTVLVNEDIYGKKPFEEVKTADSQEPQKKLDALYMELGKAYYEGGYEDPLPQLLPLFDQISELLKPEEVADLICARCGAQLDDDARFCEVCGMPVGQPPQEEPLVQEPICVNCGNPLREGAAFCGMCGTKVE